MQVAVQDLARDQGQAGQAAGTGPGRLALGAPVLDQKEALRALRQPLGRDGGGDAPAAGCFGGQPGLGHAAAHMHQHQPARLGVAVDHPLPDPAFQPQGFKFTH